MAKDTSAGKDIAAVTADETPAQIISQEAFDTIKTAIVASLKVERQARMDEMNKLISQAQAQRMQMDALIEMAEAMSLSGLLNPQAGVRSLLSRGGPAGGPTA